MAEVEVDIDISDEMRQKLDESWNKAGISNDFIFAKVMQDEQLLAELVHTILPDISFSKLVIQSQKTVETGMDTHGVRFDIFALDDIGRAIEIEMQVLNRGNLPRRMRFYGSLVDSSMLEKGALYSTLKDSYVIMICPFDQYKLGLHKYTFTNRCWENLELEMGDGTTKIVLNADSTADDVSPKLHAFLDYVAGRSSADEFVEKLEKAVKKAKANKIWRKEYMTLEMRDLENQEIGKEIGKALGKKDMVRNMLVDGKTPDEIVSFCGISIDLVREVQDELLIENAGLK